MEAAGKTPVNVIQELLAIHTNRKEAYERLLVEATDETLKQRLQKYLGQSEVFTKGLLNELSQFGDGVSGEVDMDNAFSTYWKEKIGNTDQLDNGQATKLVDEMEKLLAAQYQQYDELEVEMPASARNLIAKQAREITAA